jgi:hypothetical protein
VQLFLGTTAIKLKSFTCRREEEFKHFAGYTKKGRRIKKSIETALNI